MPSGFKTALVCGAGGFIGSHLVKRLASEGFYIRGVDRKLPEFSASAANEFLLLDLRDPANCVRALDFNGNPPDLVFQLAADMGGMGFIHTAECEIMHNSVLVNANMTDAAARAGVKRYFFSSSVCVYRDMVPGEPAIDESGAFPAMPDNEYGWEKLYSERMLAAFGRKYGMDVRIARFQNCFGPEGTWRGGREKAPAAICRKVAEASEGDEIEIWGDGSAIRCYIYVDDLIDGVMKIMMSDIEGPVNIGIPEYINVRELVEIVSRVAGKSVRIKSIPGPVGVHSRAFSIARLESLGWRPHFTVEQGIAATYPWIAAQVAADR